MPKTKNAVKQKIEPSPVDDRQARAKAASEELRALLDKYNVVVVCTNLNIETGKVIPEINLIAI
jgi:hypothetical protein